MSDITEMFVRISIHPEYGYTGAPGNATIAGIGDMRAYHRLNHHDVWTITQVVRDRNNDEANYRFFAECYDLENYQARINRQSSSAPLPADRVWADLDTTLPVEKLARLWSLLNITNEQILAAEAMGTVRDTTNERVFTAEDYRSGNAPIAKQARRKYPPDLIDVDALNAENQSVARDCYVDVFRRDPATGTVYLRCEYKAGATGMWRNVSVMNLSNDREPTGASIDHFPIPADQECYVLLSRTKLTVERLEQIRLRLQNGQPCPRVVTIPKQVTVVYRTQASGPPRPEAIATTSRRRLEEIAEKRSADEEIPEELYANIEEHRHMVLDPTGDLRLVLTDNKGYADTLRGRIDVLAREIDEFVGDHAGSDEERLQYLVAATAAQRQAWNKIVQSERQGLKDAYATYEAKVGARAWFAGQLAWWMTRDQLSETLYDYAFGATVESPSEPGHGQEIREYVVDLLNGLAQIPTTTTALETLTQNATDDFRAALDRHNQDLLVAFQYSSVPYWDHEGTFNRWNTAFSALEAYDEAAKPPHFLIEVLYPRAKKTSEIAFKAIEALARPLIKMHSEIITHRYVARRIVGWIKHLPDGYHVHFVTLDPVVLAWTEEVPVVEYVSSRKVRRAQDVIDSGIPDTLKRAIAAIDLAIAVGNAVDDGMTWKEGVTLMKSAVLFAKEWQDITGKGAGTASTSTRAKVTVGQSVVDTAWRHSAALFDIVLGVMDLHSLGVQKGDWDAALVVGGGGIAIGVLSIVFTGPVAAIVLAFAGMGVGLVGKALTDDEYERWLRYTRFGDRYQELTDGRRGIGEAMVSGWPDFYRQYVANDMTDPEAEAYHAAVVDGATGHWVQPANQIVVYERLLYNIDIKTADIWYFHTGRPFLGYFIVELVLNARTLLADTHITVDLEEETATGAVLTRGRDIVLNKNNSLLRDGGRSDDGHVITTYLYKERDVLNEFLRNCRFVGDDPTAMGHAYIPNALSFSDATDLLHAHPTMPRMKVRISLYLPEADTGEPATVVKERRLRPMEIDLSMVRAPLTTP